MYVAKSIGLLIPKTLVTNRQDEILKFYRDCNGDIITKCIKYPLKIKSADCIFLGKNTFKVKLSHIHQIAKFHSFGIYQKYIKKLYEIRAFVYKDKVFSMAIFSQSDNKTKVDFRN